VFATPKNAIGSMHLLKLRDRGLDSLTPGGAGELLRTQTVALLRTGIRRMTRADRGWKRNPAQLHWRGLARALSDR
jgi:hypothetical protein